MRRSVVVTVFFMLSGAFSLSLSAGTLFYDDFSDGGNWQDNWYQLGSAGGEILQVDGHLELDRSMLEASKQLSAITNERFDFTDGLTFQGVLTSLVTADEVQFWVANEDGKGQAEDDPWFTANWVRVMLANGNIFYQRANQGGGGGGGDAGHTPMQIETPYKISIYITLKECTVYIDGEEIIKTDHEQDFNEGHLIFAAWTTGPGDGNHILDDAFVYEGDYDPNPTPGSPVESQGKLATTWAGVKAK
jgi:hypothetical protein